MTGIWPLTYVGKYQGRVAAANILGTPREANYDAVPRVVFTDPQAASVGEAEGAVSATVPLAGVPRTSTYTRAYDEKPGFMTLVSDGERLTGAYALGPEAGEWLQQATLAIRAEVPLGGQDMIQPFPTFSEIFLVRAHGAGHQGSGRRGGLAPGRGRHSTPSQPPKLTASSEATQPGGVSSARTRGKERVPCGPTSFPAGRFPTTS